MAEQWPGKAQAKAGNFYTLPDGKVRFYAGGDEFRVGGVDNQGLTRLDTGALLGQFFQGLAPKGAVAEAMAQAWPCMTLVVCQTGRSPRLKALRLSHLGPPRLKASSPSSIAMLLATRCTTR